MYLSKIARRSFLIIMPLLSTTFSYQLIAETLQEWQAKSMTEINNFSTAANTYCTDAQKKVSGNVVSKSEAQSKLNTLLTNVENATQQINDKKEKFGEKYENALQQIDSLNSVVSNALKTVSVSTDLMDID